MKIKERVRSMLWNFLQIQPAMDNSIVIQEPLSFQASVIRNQIWYRGDATELDQLYKQLGACDIVNASRFWAAVPESQKLRKIHSGLPGILVDTLAYLVRSDLDDIKFKDDVGKDDWENICKELDFSENVGQGIIGALSSGDGAWKVSFAPDFPYIPVVEFYGADRVNYIRHGGRIVGIDFWTLIQNKFKTYKLRESYRKGSVHYALFLGESEVPLESCPELEDLKPVEFDGDFMLAVPFKIYDNPKFPGRGKSIYEGKTDCFDALDEIISQWMDAIRAGRVVKYIPRDLIPTNPQNGEPLPPNDFGSHYIVTEPDNHENAASKIETVHPEIRYEAYLNTYLSALDMCLQGIVSPATLGIDIGKMSSADAQREKKDVTGYTRNVITGALEKALPQLISVILMSCDVAHGDVAGKYEPAVSFGEYGAPSFDARVDTVNKAAAAGTMSIETQVDELWGSSKDDNWKAAEVARIKQTRGIETADGPPAVGDELNGDFLA